MTWTSQIETSVFSEFPEDYLKGDGMRVFVAEKPELARAIAEGLGGGKRGDGCIECGQDKVTWCFGHMLELWEPEDYDGKYKKWSLDDLPFSFVPWRKKPTARGGEQLRIILSLLKSAGEAVNAGDPDGEGQLLVDEVLEHAKFKGRVKRVLINDNNTPSVKKALAAMRDNAEFKGLSDAAEARQVADQLYGYNMSRLYTLAGRKKGLSAVLSVGRVQTPILGLIVRRDRENAGHRKSFYYIVTGQFEIGGKKFPANYQPAPPDAMDGKNRLTDEGQANAIAQLAAGRPARIVEAKTEIKHTPPPLPYNLLKLQTDASRKFGLAPDKVKDITQALREKHRLITYNRSDCQYLPEEQHADAPEIIKAIGANCRDLAPAAGRANAKLKSKAFDSGKITAHHAIVPTLAKVAETSLSEDERRIYQLIATAYLAQFYPPYKYEHTAVKVEAEGKAFACEANAKLEAGWKCLYGADDESEEKIEPEEKQVIQTSLKGLEADQAGVCADAGVNRLETRPKPLYTMASLLTDLTRVAQYIKDEKLKKALIDKDRDKAGEHGGIGTPATRDAIIKTLFDRGFITAVKKGKASSIISTQIGRDLYDALPDEAKFPDLTAIWHGQQQDIEAGKLGVKEFIANLVDYMAGETEKVRANGLDIKTDLPPCPACGGGMTRRKGKNGFFWGCSGYPECKATLPDDNGKPGEAKARANEIQTGEKPSCPACGKPMRLLQGQKGEFWGCTGYPECKKTLSRKAGDSGEPMEKPIVSEIHKCPICGRGLSRRRDQKSPDRYWWGCSGYPGCKKSFPDQDGKPNYEAQKRTPEKTGKEV